MSLTLKVTLIWLISIIAVCKDSYVVYACGETKTENENDSVNQNDIAKMMLQKGCCKNDIAK